MIAFAHRDRATLRRDTQSLQSGFAGRSPAVFHRRSRINPAFVLGAFAAALLFDALSSAAALGAYRLIWQWLSANPIAAIVAALVLALATCLVIAIVIARFARSRGAQGAPRAKN